MSVLVAVPRLGLGTKDQLVPFQDSMRVLKSWWPTAVHAATETQDTLRRVLLPARLGLGTTDQLVPFQDSTRVLESWWPTAVHAAAETQDTPFNAALVVPAGSGLGTTDQLVPFQDSMRGRVVLLFAWEPAAVHASTEMQDTP